MMVPHTPVRLDRPEPFHTANLADAVLFYRLRADLFIGGVGGEQAGVLLAERTGGAAGAHGGGRTRAQRTVVQVD